jgi:hypothetical protein
MEYRNGQSSESCDGRDGLERHIVIPRDENDKTRAVIIPTKHAQKLDAVEEKE